MSRRIVIRAKAMPIPAVTRGIVICAMLFAAIATSPVLADGVFAVPDNVAPRPAPMQPLPFSHETHLAAGPVCATCHVNPEPGDQMTYPSTDTCMSCHVAIATDRPSIESLHAFAQSEQKIPWARVYAVTPGVTWSHKPHLQSGEHCETCHGDVSQAEVVSETKSVLAMASCIGCHEDRGAKTECVTCHAWPTDEILGIE